MHQVFPAECQRKHDYERVDQSSDDGVPACARAGEREMMAALGRWVDQQSPEALIILFPLLFVGFSWVGIILIRPFLRFWLRRQPGANDLVSFASAGFTLFYGLLLGLLSVATYQNTKDVEDNINREALGIGTIYRATSGYPEPLKGELQANLRDYTLYVIKKDWPAHRKGVTQMGGEHRLQVIREQLLSFEPGGKTQEILHNEVLKYFNATIGHREHRLSGVTTSIPTVLWYVVGIGALINIAFMWMLDMKFVPNLILNGLVSFFLGVMIFLIYSMDRPLRSAVSVAPTAYQSTYDAIMKWDVGS
jgi:hypothetical protein